jgi:glycerol-3-phosphate acyltransferase PlsY
VKLVLASLVVVAAYALGSLPFSFWVARRRGVDVREVGSGNVGATNVLRSAGRTAGVVAFVLDALKGALASLLGGWVDPHGMLAPLAAVAAVAGHTYPVWLRFRGGKGVATAFGAIALLAPLAVAVAIGAFALALAVSRFVSLASIVAALTLATVAPLLGASRATSLCIAGVAVLIVVRHHGNIARLLRGQEPRVGGAAADTGRGAA